MKILVIINIILSLYFFSNLVDRIESIEGKITLLGTKVPSQKELNARNKIVAKEIKKIAKSVFSIRCEDSGIGKTKKKWLGTGSKISDHYILTADHIISNNGDEKEKTFPIQCKLFSQGQEAGNFDSTLHSFQQLGKKDIAFMEVKMNAIGLSLPNLIPYSNNPEVGEMLVLVAHTKHMVNDYLINFGFVLNANAEKLLPQSRKDYWENSIITDMTASPGSSGSPVFESDGKWIGIHVGGDRDQGLNANYQILFDTEFMFKHKIYKFFNKKLQE